MFSMVFPYMPFDGKSEKLVQNTGYFGLPENYGTQLLPSILTIGENHPCKYLVT